MSDALSDKNDKALQEAIDLANRYKNEKPLQAFAMLDCHILARAVLRLSASPSRGEPDFVCRKEPRCKSPCGASYCPVAVPSSTREKLTDEEVGALCRRYWEPGTPGSFDNLGALIRHVEAGALSLPSATNAPVPLGGSYDINTELVNCEWPADKPFTMYDDPDEHKPCWLVLPDGAMISFNYHGVNGVNQAQVRWIMNTLNAARRPDGKNASG